MVTSLNWKEERGKCNFKRKSLCFKQGGGSLLPLALPCPGQLLPLGFSSPSWPSLLIQQGMPELGALPAASLEPQQGQSWAWSASSAHPAQGNEPRFLPTALGIQPQAWKSKSVTAGPVVTPIKVGIWGYFWGELLQSCTSPSCRWVLPGGAVALSFCVRVLEPGSRTQRRKQSEQEPELGY